ncbi:MAG: hypothetical protein AB4290_09010 [Spirulina sp.]
MALGCICGLQPEKKIRENRKSEQISFNEDKMDGLTPAKSAIALPIPTPATSDRPTTNPKLDSQC